jgi:carbamoyltransferase
MIILGLHDNHSATVCLLVDGIVIAVAEEERYTRIKMDSGFPKNAIDSLRNQYPEEFSNIDYVAVACIHQSFNDFATKRYPKFKIKDFLVEEKRYWLPILNGEKPNYLEVMKDYVDYSYCHYDLKKINNPKDSNELLELRKSHISNYLNVSEDKVVFVDHHLAHAHHGYYSSLIREDALIFTIDGWGDHANASINTIRDGKINCIYKTDQFNLGRIYHFVTLLLGMQPEQHEYKVMGLAAYAKEHYIEEPLKVFERMYKIDGLTIKPLLDITNHYQYLRRELEGYRFDAIAGAVQRFTENILTEWVQNWTLETGLSKVILTGGVALNIKASKIISELDSISNIHVAIASGDESISIGAAQYLWNESQNPMLLKPIDSPYLGQGYNSEDINEALEHPFVKQHYDIVENCSSKDIAEILARGEIVAYMQGRMEFGPRALGNRSILASPVDTGIVQVINTAIKNRDFWMPFTPSILDEFADEYIVNPKNIDARYMTMAFNSTDAAKTNLRAAIHQVDSTLRAQIVYKDLNPNYHDIISEFSKITGVGALLNTSLNIHGKPIVHKPIDVIDEILLHPLVELKYFVFDKYLISLKES